MGIICDLFKKRSNKETMVRIALIAITVALAARCYAQQECKIIADTNDCSVPIKNAPFANTFIPACTRHDVCYRCAAKYGWTQQACDSTFLKDLKTVCEREDKGDQGKDKRALGDYWTKLKEITAKLADFWKKVKSGWDEAKKNGSSKDELKRMWAGMKDMYELVKDYLWEKDDWTYKQECDHVATIYYSAVALYGNYRQYPKPLPNCNEPCAQKLGDPNGGL